MEGLHLRVIRFFFFFNAVVILQVELNSEKMKFAVIKMLRHSDVRGFTYSISEQNKWQFTEISLMFLQLALDRTNIKESVI